MICRRCLFPLIFSGEGLETTTVFCTHCGAHYEIRITLLEDSPLTQAELDRIRNRPSR